MALDFLFSVWIVACFLNTGHLCLAKEHITSTVIFVIVVSETAVATVENFFEDLLDHYFLLSQAVNYKC